MPATAGAGHRITAVALDELTVDDLAAVRRAGAVGGGRVAVCVAQRPHQRGQRQGAGHFHSGRVPGIRSSAQPGDAGGPVLRHRGLSEAQQGRRDHGETGGEAVRELRERSRPSDQAERLAVYRDRSVQGAGGDIWAIGGGRQHHGDPVLGEPFFSALQCGAADLFFGGEPR